jgi:hypothetical protein
VCVHHTADDLSLCKAICRGGKGVRRLTLSQAKAHDCLRSNTTEYGQVTSRAS